jgi:hypothetical protein
MHTASAPSVSCWISSPYSFTGGSALISILCVQWYNADVFFYLMVVFFHRNVYCLVVLQILKRAKAYIFTPQPNYVKKAETFRLLFKPDPQFNSSFASALFNVYTLTVHPTIFNQTFCLVLVL